MSPEEPTPQHDDDPADVIGAHRWRIDGGTVMYSAWCYCGWNEPLQNTRKSARRLHGEHVIAALKAAGFEITKGHGITGEVKFERNEQPYVNLTLPGGQRVTGWVDNRIEGVTVGDGLWFPNPDDLTDTALIPPTVVDLEGSLMGKALSERIKPSALDQLAPGASDAAKSGAKAGMELASRLLSLSADVRLAAALDVIGRRTDIVAVQLPEPDEGVWYVNEGGCNVHLGPPGGVLVDAGAMLWGINTDEARTLAAALLAAAARADAAEGEAK